MCKKFIKIPSGLFESNYWQRKRVFNEFEAVVDIMSQIELGMPDGSSNIRGREIKCSKKEWPASIRFLANRWKWTERKVRTFIASLKADGIISIDDSQGVNIIRLKEAIKQDDTPNDTVKELNDNTLDCVLTHQMTQQDNVLGEDDEYSFDKFWDLYDKKVGKEESERLYGKLSRKDKMEIFEYVPKYKIAQPDKSFRQGPTRFLRRRSWKDEIITRGNGRQLPIGFNLTDNGENKYNNDIKGW